LAVGEPAVALKLGLDPVVLTELCLDLRVGLGLRRLLRALAVVLGLLAAGILGLLELLLVRLLGRPEPLDLGPDPAVPVDQRPVAVECRPAVGHSAAEL